LDILYFVRCWKCGGREQEENGTSYEFFNFRKLSQIEERWHGEMIFTENIYACNYIKKNVLVSQEDTRVGKSKYMSLNR